MGRAPLVVGLAGKACAGKDVLVPVFTRRGFAVIDADRLGHSARQANEAEILRRFGTCDRGELGKIVFRDPRALRDLENLTHPWIRGEIRRLVEAAQGPVVINAAILHRLAPGICDLVVWVQAPLWRRLLRARKRDRRPWNLILQRVWAQRKLNSQVFSGDVDILRVTNDGSLSRALSALEKRLDAILVDRYKEDHHEEQ